LFSWLHLKFVPKFKHFQNLDSTISLLHFGSITIYYSKTKVLYLSWFLNPIANDGFQVSKLVFIIVYFKDSWWGWNLESHDAKSQALIFCIKKFAFWSLGFYETIEVFFKSLDSLFKSCLPFWWSLVLFLLLVEAFGI
jgi:hypothetical protein